MLIKSSKLLIETIEIAKFVHKLGQKKFLDILGKSKSREAIIYRFIEKSQTQLTDNDIIRALKLEKRAYQKALSDLKTILIESILDFDLSRANYSDYAQRLFHLDIAHARLRILERLTATYSANAEAKVWLKECEELEQWHLAISFLSPL